jgi:hypothetical protein
MVGNGSGREAGHGAKKRSVEMQGASGASNGGRVCLRAQVTRTSNHLGYHLLTPPAAWPALAMGSIPARNRVKPWWSARSAVLRSEPCRNLPGFTGPITAPQRPLYRVELMSGPANPRGHIPEWLSPSGQNTHVAFKKRVFPCSERSPNSAVPRWKATWRVPKGGLYR